MLSRVRLTGASPIAQPAFLAPNNSQVQVRCMAGGQKQLKQRINAVGNVKKITKAMQLIASSKVKAAERRMHLARSFAKDLVSTWPIEAKQAEGPQHVMFLPVCSDRGLCGSLNTGVTRAIKKRADERLASKQPFSIFTVGEKARAHLERTYSNQLAHVVHDAGKSKPVNFSEASLIADYVVRQQFDEIHVYYNRFVNSLSNELKIAVLPSLSRTLADREAFKDYELEGVDEELLENLYEFRTAVQVFYFMSENACSEMSSRVNSMSNSSKNASELVDKLLLQYNRTRQSQVTTELMEVISGAIAVQ